MFKRNKHYGSQKLEEFPDEIKPDVEMSPNIGSASAIDGGGSPSSHKGKPYPDDPRGSGSLEAKLPLMFRIRGTVIKGIWWQILIVVLWSTCVVSIYTYVENVQFKFRPILIQLMGVVCGLLLAFRSNSAYDRYWEGRKYWSTMTLGIRTLTRAIWINIKAETSGDIVEKKSAINLLIAFAIATKHYLREEYDYDFEDLLDITPHISWLNTPSSTQSFGKQQNATSSEKISPETIITVTTGTGGGGGSNVPSGSIKKKSSQLIPTMSIRTRPKTKPIKHVAQSQPKQYRFKAHDISTPTNIPLELSYYIGSYINSVRIREKLCDSGTIGIMNSALAQLVECLTGFERILRTPIPMAYSVHLHQSIWIYILALPFQLVPDNQWWTILVVGITAFFLLGILAIGWELENPFGYDDNDLPLDDFCKVLRREIEVIVSHKAVVPEDWVFKAENKPFSPECELNAIELTSKSINEVLEILADRGIKISKVDVLSETEPDVPEKIRSGKRRKPNTPTNTNKGRNSSGNESEVKKMLP